jgi:hypothetical protein
VDQNLDYDTGKKAHGAPVDALKVQNFARENPGADFPPFAPLGPSECTQLRTAIATRLGLDAQSEPLVILNTLRANASSLAEVNAEDEFDFRGVVSGLGIKARAEVLVNWHRFDNIDRVALLDLSKHFDYIWYPSSDDIESFDESLDWFVLICHDGEVSAFNLSTPRSSR